ncbi:MAG: methyltransferase domain-containing protein [Clostridia bacterium]|nr:methyltransferase domain-containing protein [Clostridia bacterium]
MVNYFYDCYTILNKVYSDKTFLKQVINSTFIKEKNRALIIKTCYGVLDKDIELSYYLSALTEKSPKLAIRTILKISMYAIKYLQKKEYAVTKNAVELTKKLGKGGAAGFVNAYLRKFINTNIDMPKDKIEYLSIKYSYPKFAVNELVNIYGIDRTESIISATNESTCLAFYNCDGEDYLKSKNVQFSLTPFDNVYIAKNFIRNEDYDKGLYTYQALGSVAICDVVDPCKNLLDCCAAPGGKSIRLSYKCDSVTSWDIHEHRVELIEDYKRRMGRENICANVQDAKEFISGFENKFDAVLVDAPCSGLGVMNDNPDIKLNRTKLNVKQLNVEQISILKTVSRYVKKGGYLYYSTCSVLNSENIEIINAFMSDVKGFEICEIDSKLQHENVCGTNAFLPDISGGLGFYVAKLKRIN